MKSPDPDISKLKNDGFDLSTTTTKPSINAVGNQHPHRHLNEFALFTSFFNCLPNTVQEQKVDVASANAWFVKKYQEEIKDFYFSKLSFGNSEQPRFDDCYYFIGRDLLVYFDVQQNRVKLLFKYTPIAEVESLLAEIRKFRKRKNMKPELSLIVQSQSGIELKNLEVTRSTMSLDDHYKDDFPEVHQAILKRLRRKKDKGIVLLHGKPGTGKTSYIRYLISRLKKHVIFLPPNMARGITNPDLLGLLIDNPDSVLVIEDAENLIPDRERSADSPVSTLLNISDGLLSDCLNIQIICSFNTDLSKVDNALIRKGRLIAKYEFKELSAAKAQKLSEKLGYKKSIDHPMSLADIYNQQERDFAGRNTESKIGFRSLKAS